VLSAEPSFYDGEAGELIPRSVSFAGLPTKQLFTLNPIVPDSWMVQSAEAEFDLDNIKLASAPRNILARYELTHILLEGHCFDDDTGNPPRGLQFVLGTKRQPAQFDTVYFPNTIDCENYEKFVLCKNLK
jgi:UDP-glucose:glycoprotein glucosyltransferase